MKPENDPETRPKTYSYDPHLDPPLVWAGKVEHTGFEVPTVSLHVHERIDPKTILAAVRKKNGEPARGSEQFSLFAQPKENRPLRAELDEERSEAYRGATSLPFAAKRGQKVAVKVVDDRGIESLRVMEVD